MCVCVCVCVRQRGREERGREGFPLSPSLRVWLLQFGEAVSSVRFAVCVCVCVCVVCGGRARCPSQEDRVGIDENPSGPFDASFPLP